MYKMACTFVGCLMAICSVFAQDNLTFVHQLHHFSVNDGLPSSEVYYALQDYVISRVKDSDGSNELYREWFTLDEVQEDTVRQVMNLWLVIANVGGI